MDKNTYKNLLDDAAKHLQSDSLMPALTVLESLAGLLADWDTTSRLNDIRRSYSALLTYFRSGAEDQERERMYRNFLCKTDEIWCGLYRNYLVNHTETAYAQAVSVLRHMSEQPAPEHLLNTFSNQPATLFDSVWTAEPFTDSIAALFRTFFEDDDTDAESKQIIASALTLAALEVFDPLKLHLLIGISRNGDTSLRARAMVGTVLVFATHPQRIARYPELSIAVEVEYEKATARHELMELQMQLLLSMETKRIARSMREEIMPEMLRNTKGFVPQNAEDFSRLNAEMAELGLNPEWEHDTKRSEIGKKIRHLIEMQQKGADIYLSSFAMLKNRFPFFRQAANWFLPFNSSSPALQLDGTRKAFADTMAKFGMLCDSDKYSLALLIAQMPETQFAMLQTQIEAMMPETSELQEQETTFTTTLRTTLQDFYRFATLFNHRDTALNPFRQALLLTSIPPFAKLIGSSDTLQQIAVFAFDEGNYSVALPLISRILEHEPTARFWQMAGYCHQRAGNFEKAVEAYDRSGLFGEQSAWTIRQLAACHRAAGNYAEALGYYEKMSADQPNNIPLLIRHAQCLQETGHTNEALELLHKADYLEEIPAEGTRALQEIQFHTGRFEAAFTAGRRLLAAQPLPADRLLTAHSAWLNGDTSEAVALYKGYYSRLEPAERAERQVAELLFDKERVFLLQNGKTQVDLQIMADAISEIQE